MRRFEPVIMDRQPDSLLLAHLCRGQMAVVESLEHESNEHHQLHEMGLRPGQIVTMLAPGNPCAVVVGDTRLMMRAELLEGVRVTVIG